MSAVKVQELSKGQVIWYDNDWRTILSWWQWKKGSPVRLGVSQPNSTIPLAVKLYADILVEVKMKEDLTHVHICSAIAATEALSKALKDLATIVLAPGDTVAIFTDVELDKATLRKAAKDTVNKQAAILKELIGKI